MGIALPKEFLDKFKRIPLDVVGLDITSSGVKAVRIKKNNTELSVVAADILPPVTVIPATGEEPEHLAPIVLPPKLKGKYASVTISGEDAVVKLLSLPGHFDAEMESKVIEAMGVEKPDEFRISYKLISEGHGKAESRILGVAISEIKAGIINQILPVGLPAPFSLELSGLSALTAFMNGPGVKDTENASGVINFEEDTCTFAIFNKNILVLIRRFDIGMNSLLQKVQDSLGVDRETAQGIVSDGSFDISQAVTEVMEPLVKQLIVSRDFVERRENCHLGSLYVSGGIVVSRDSIDEMKSALGVDVLPWNPLEGLVIAAGAVPENLAGQEWQFTAATGACLATLEHT